MRMIFKVPIKDTHYTLELPADADVLHVAVQDETPMIWFMFDPSETEIKKRKFMIVGTGMMFDYEGWQYIGTFMQQPYVWHLFEESEDE